MEKLQARIAEILRSHYEQLRVSDETITFTTTNGESHCMVVVSIERVTFEGMQLDVQVLWWTEEGELLVTSNIGRDAKFLSTISEHFELEWVLGVEGGTTKVWPTYLAEVFVPVNTLGLMVEGVLEEEVYWVLSDWDNISRLVVDALQHGSNPTLTLLREEEPASSLLH